MDLDKLKTFYFVAIEGSIKKAEHHLGIKSSFISKQISALERELNTKLFKRHYRGLSLTDSGQNLLSSAQHIMNEVESISSNFKGRQNEPLKGTLRIVTTNGLSSYFTVNLVKNILRDYPELTVKLLCDQPVIDFRDYQADVAFITRATEGRNYVNCRVGNLKSFFYASKAYIEEMGMPQSVEDLVNHRLIASRYDRIIEVTELDYHMQLAKKVDPDFQPYLVINSLPAYIHSAYIGLGIIQTTELFPYIEQLNLIKILPDIHLDVPLYMTYSVNSKKLKKIQILEQLTKENIL